MEPAMQARSVCAKGHATNGCGQRWTMQSCELCESISRSWRWSQRCGHNLCALRSMLPVCGQSCY